MMLLLILLLGFLANFAFSVEPPPFICVAISAAPGPLNAQKIAPINCQFVNGTMTVCYPQTNQTFPKQFPTRVYCTPMPPPTTTTPQPTPTTTLQNIRCSFYISSFDGPPNAQGVLPVVCFIPITLVVCFPLEPVVFNQAFNCAMIIPQPPIPPLGQ